jgi:elongator complex protein 6
VTLAADEALVLAQTTSLEKDHASLVLSLAHEAEMLISLRLLDTGTARDVSGVLRVTPGGGATGLVQEEKELLYFVGADGGVRVFERGQ